MKTINFQPFLKTAEKLISSQDFYWQSLSIIGCLIFSYLFYRILRKSIFPKITSSRVKKNVELSRIIGRYFIPFLYPITAIVFLAIGSAIYGQFFKETFVFTTMIKLVTLLTFLRFLRISSNSNFTANAVGFILVPALILDTFGLLNSTTQYLDQYALIIGDVRLSIYVVLKGFTILLIVFWLTNLISKKSKSYIANNKNIKSSTKNILSKMLDISIYSFIFLVTLKAFGVDMTALAVIGGAVGVGIGFGLQKIASNFISGIILLFEQSIEIGDIVEIENGAILGTVKHFGGRYTLIECFDGKEIMVPNEEFIISKVTNWTYSNNRARIEITVGVAYGSDLEKAQKIMMDCATDHPRCLSYPEPGCFITEFGDSSINILLMFWISDIIEGRYGPKSDVILAIEKKFKEEGISIPFPQREIRILNQ